MSRVGNLGGMVGGMMSRKKDRFIAKRRAGTFPKCFPKCCETCLDSGECRFYPEYVADQYAAAVKEEAARKQSEWVSYG